VDGDDDGGSRDRRPVPDPTVLTTEQMLREVAALRREVDLQFKLRLGIIDERFKSVDTQFQLVERQRVELKLDTKTAVDAALAAAKEAVTTNQTSTAEQLKAQAQAQDTAIEALRTNHEDLKERVGKVESTRQGGEAKVGELRAVLIIGLTLATLVLGVIVFVANQMTGKAG
jgi:chromosome segregation ATPase